MRKLFEATWVALLLPSLAVGCDDAPGNEQRELPGTNPAPLAGGAAGGSARGAAGRAGAAPIGEAGGSGGVAGAAGAPNGELTERFPGPPGTPDTTAIGFADPAIVAWATGVATLSIGAESTNEAYHVEAQALGPATGSNTDVLVLGDAGEVTLTFDEPIHDGPGFDFAIFENAVNDTFLELAFVEVSSDGETFVRFPSTYLGTEPVSSFGGHDARDIDGLAGKYPVGYGTPFDLAVLAAQSRVVSGRVELDRITHVRIVDIVGDGSVRDSQGRPIYDPYPTVNTAGFDLEAVGVLNVAP